MNTITWNDVDIRELLYKQSHPSWHEIFKLADRDLDHTIQKLTEKIKTNSNIFPRPENVFKCFSVPLDSIRVVIIGQDPYHDSVGDKPRANGLAFSSAAGITPPSLRNIIKEISSEYPDSIFETDDLTYWLNQGVLLLNSCLTVNSGKPGSHKGIWFGFITKIIQEICNSRQKAIFVLWGREAQEFQSDITTHADPLVSAHPSPFSANRGFFGNDHFKKINNYLAANNLGSIDWNIKKIT